MEWEISLGRGWTLKGKMNLWKIAGFAGRSVSPPLEPCQHHRWQWMGSLASVQWLWLLTSFQHHLVFGAGSAEAECHYQTPSDCRWRAGRESSYCKPLAVGRGSVCGAVFESSLPALLSRAAQRGRSGQR